MNPVAVLMGQIEKDVGRVRLRHLSDDRPAHYVARRKFAAFVVILHETVSVLIDELSAFSAHRFRNKAAAAARDVEDGRVELDELKIAADRARTEREARRRASARRFVVS